jgi:hypothetical protein
MKPKEGGIIFYSDDIPLDSRRFFYEKSKHFYIYCFNLLYYFLCLSDYKASHQESPPYPWGGFHALGINDMFSASNTLALNRKSF